MIGQTKLISTISEQIENEVFPRFSILVGQKGSGKKTLSKLIGKKLNTNIILLEDVKVDTIRDMITKSYKIASPTLFIIPDADNMSVAAKNAILKVVEEPPNSAYFIMTLEDDHKTLSTIRSRGTVYRMDVYSSEEIMTYANNFFKEQILVQEQEVIIDICETPLEVQTLWKHGIIEFKDYIDKVVENIDYVSDSNAFKIGNKIALKKGEEDKYDLRLFWKYFITSCFHKMNEDILKYSTGISITTKYLQELSITGINKQSTFDMWLMEVREAWMNE